MRAGLANQVIADTLGISPTALEKTYPTELRADSSAVSEVADALYRSALEGNVQAQKFYLETRAGWLPKAQEQMVATLAEPLVINIVAPTP